MSESLVINNSASVDEQYQLLVKQVKSLLRKKDNLITNLSNFTAALKLLPKLAGLDFIFLMVLNFISDHSREKLHAQK